MSRLALRQHERRRLAPAATSSASSTTRHGGGGAPTSCARAAGLSADAKQKISLGRGLVRSDVSAVLFDEPLTVIDPHLKWQLRRKLKQIHH